MKLLSLVLLSMVILASCSTKETTVISSEKNSPKWQQTHPGVWKAIVNNPSDFNLLSVANKQPKAEAIAQLGDSPIPVDNNEIKAFTRNGRTYVRFPLDKEEQLYGFGLNFKHVRQRAYYALAR
jgi:alpha-D-xyloside xylohydrolase